MPAGRPWEYYGMTEDEWLGMMQPTGQAPGMGVMERFGAGGKGRSNTRGSGGAGGSSGRDRTLMHLAGMDDLDALSGTPPGWAPSENIGMAEGRYPPEIERDLSSSDIPEYRPGENSPAEGEAMARKEFFDDTFGEDTFDFYDTNLAQALFEMLQGDIQEKGSLDERTMQIAHDVYKQWNDSNERAGELEGLGDYPNR